VHSSLNVAIAVGLGLLLWHCDAAPRATERLPLSTRALPSLHCTARPALRGECARDGDCAAGERCTLDERVASGDREPIALRCGSALGRGENRARCRAGSECVSGLCGLAGVCLSPCTDDGDCLRGQACQVLEARLGDSALASVAACARTAAFPPDVALDVLAPQALGAGQLNSLHAPIADDDVLLFARVDCARALQLQRVVAAADGRVWFDVARQLDGVVQLNPSVNAGSLLPVLLPNNPRLRLSARGYELLAIVDEDAEATLVTASRSTRGTRLDLNVFYVGGGADLAEGGLHPGDARFAAVLTRLAARYERIGLRLGAVREYDVVGALRDELATLEVSIAPERDGGASLPRVDGLSVLFALSAGVDDGGINLFLVSDMGPLLGISGGIPGALGLHGTRASGVAIALDVAGVERADAMIFHEICHQMGLFHTTELDGFVMEPLSDTASCPKDLDVDQDGILRSEECQTRDGENLMFWEARGDALSPQQIEVLKRSLVLM
jgi:hypothetical protein